jgi:hypothetical protein
MKNSPIDEEIDRIARSLTAEPPPDALRSAVFRDLVKGSRIERRYHYFGVAAGVGVLIGVLVWSGQLPINSFDRLSRGSSEVTPAYDSGRNLQLPDDYLRWVIVGSSLSLSYSDADPDQPMFNTTLMEPTAYDYFVKTGEFREGTMFALVLQGVGTNATPARHGQFASDIHAVEMSVKDTSRVSEGWAYYDFGGPMSGGYRAAAAPQPPSNCHNCHAEHAARDNVFTQFYGLLNSRADVLHQ